MDTKGKLLTFVIPCYNSQEYMRRSIDSVLLGGEDIEVIIVDDGSTDNTGVIADDYERRFPGIVRAIHQKNGGHGAGVNAGIKNATGTYFKVVDSDDSLDPEAYKTVMERLHGFEYSGDRPDLVVTDFLYDKEGKNIKKTMENNWLPKNRMFSWKDITHYTMSHYILMHSALYRTQLLRDCGVQLPEHTFYVDNIYVYYPLPYVKKLYYLPVVWYKYFIGRDDQSVNEAQLAKRVDQYIRVTKIMVDDTNLAKVPDKMCRKYMINYLQIVLTVTCMIMINNPTPENLKKKIDLWRYIRAKDEILYQKLRRNLLGILVNPVGDFGHRAAHVCYMCARGIFGFN